MPQSVMVIFFSAKIPTPALLLHLVSDDNNMEDSDSDTSSCTDSDSSDSDSLSDEGTCMYKILFASMF